MCLSYLEDRQNVVKSFIVHGLFRRKAKFKGFYCARIILKQKQTVMVIFKQNQTVKVILKQNQTVKVIFKQKQTVMVILKPARF